MEKLPERAAYKSAGRVADLIYVEYIVALPQGQRGIFKKKHSLGRLLNDFCSILAKNNVAADTVRDAENRLPRKSLKPADTSSYLRG